jgi:hypothetical protein
MKVISQGYILMEKRDRVGDVVMVKNNISTVIEGVGSVIREVRILSVVARKYK